MEKLKQPPSNFRNLVTTIKVRMLDGEIKTIGYIFKKLDTKKLKAKFPNINFTSLENLLVCNAFGKPAVGREILAQLNQANRDMHFRIVADDGAVAIGDLRKNLTNVENCERNRNLGNSNIECILGNSSAKFSLADFKNLLFDKCNHHFTGLNAWKNRLNTDSSCLQRWKKPTNNPNYIITQLDDPDSIMSFFLSFGSIRNSLTNTETLEKLIMAINAMDKTFGQGDGSEIPDIYWYFYSEMQKLIGQKATPEDFIFKILELITQDFEQKAKEYAKNNNELISQNDFEQIPKETILLEDQKIMILDRASTQKPNFRILAIENGFTHCFYVDKDGKVSWFCKGEQKSVDLAQDILEQLETKYNIKIHGKGSMGGGNKQETNTATTTISQLTEFIKEIQNFDEEL